MINRTAMVTTKKKNTNKKMTRNMKILNGMRNGISKINQWKYFCILISIDLKKVNM